MLSVDELLSKLNNTNSVDKLLDFRNNLQNAIKDFSVEPQMVRDFNYVIQKIDDKLNKLK